MADVNMAREVTVKQVIWMYLREVFFWLVFILLALASGISFGSMFSSMNDQSPWWAVLCLVLCVAFGVGAKHLFRFKDQICK
jgi:hypothetical protein